VEFTANQQFALKCKGALKPVQYVGVGMGCDILVLGFQGNADTDRGSGCGTVVLLHRISFTIDST
jgi:hypothetical protein